jgi:hypothetical protein
MATVQHLAVFSASVAASQANLAMAPITDGILTILSNGYVVPQTAKVLWGYYGGVGALRARINTPKYRYVGYPSILGVNYTVAPPSPMNIEDWSEFPLMVDPVDAIVMEVSTDATGTSQMYAALNFSFGNMPYSPAPVYCLRATAAITNVANVWGSGSLTFDQTLPSGHYVICGMDCVATDVLFARLIIPGSVWRPGCVARATDQAITNYVMRPAHNGCLGEFDSINVPNLEIMGPVGSTAQEVFLYVQRTGPISGQQLSNPVV